MSKLLFNKWSKQQPSHRAARAATAAAARASVEPLERREMFTVTTGISGLDLEINSGNGDAVTIDHAGTNTLVNGVAIPDSKFSFIQLNVGSFFGAGINNVNVRALTKFLTIESPGRINSLVIGGKTGLGAQGIQGVITVDGMDFPSKITVDDSQSTSPRTWGMKAGFGEVEVTGIGPDRFIIQDTGFTDLILKGGSGGNTFNVEDTPVDNGILDVRNASVTVDSGTGNDTVNIRRTSGFFTSINGQSGRDTVNLTNNGSMASIRSFVHVTNQGGFSTLKLDASTNGGPKNVTMDRQRSSTGTDTGSFAITGLAPGRISYADGDVDVLTVKAGIGGNTFNIGDAVTALGLSGKTSVFTGTGTDHVFVKRTTNALDIHGQNGADVVDVGEANNSQGIRGALLVDNVSSKSILNLHNSADANARGVTLDSDTITSLETVTGLAPAKIAFKVTDVSNLGISTGSKADVFFIQGTLGANTAIHAGGGDDRFRVGSTTNTLNKIRTPLLLDGETGTDFVSIFDQGSTTPHTYTNTATTFTRSSTADPTVTIGLKSIEALDVFKGVVASTSPPLAKDLALSKKVRAGESATLTGRLEDADASDTLTLTVIWGDGSEPSVSAPGRDPFKLTHAYAAKGNYRVRVIWTDSTGESNFRELQLKVKQ
jgi:hypothetical protein